MNTLTEARSHLFKVLSDKVSVPVFDQPPSTVQPPCVVMFPGSPWLAPRGHVTFDVVAYANTAAGGPAALDRLEDLVHQIRFALFDAGLAAGDVDAPRPETTPGVLSCTMPVTFRISCY